MPAFWRLSGYAATPTNTCLPSRHRHGPSQGLATLGSLSATADHAEANVCKFRNPHVRKRRFSHHFETRELCWPESMKCHFSNRLPVLQKQCRDSDAGENLTWSGSRSEVSTVTASSAGLRGAVSRDESLLSLSTISCLTSSRMTFLRP